MQFYSIQNAFNGGELDPLVLSRVDLSRYQTGAKTMANFVPIPQGGVTRRPGTQFLGIAKNDTAQKEHTKLSPFVFSETQGRVLEIGHEYMRVWLGDGSLVLKDDAPYELELPYSSEDVAKLSLAQANDVIYVAHADYPPAKISRYADDDWRYEIVAFLPTITPPSSLTLQAMGSVPGSGTKEYSYMVTAISDENGEESQPSQAYTINTSSLTQTYFIRISWAAVTGAASYRVYKKQGGSHSYMGSTSDTSYDDVNSDVDSGDTPPEWDNPFADTGSYPSIAFFHQQRLGFAASINQPATVFLSKTASFENFSTSSPPKADDRIEATLASKQSNAIKWCESSSSGVTLGTEGSEWTLGPAEGAVLSPLDMGFEQQTFVGSGDLSALPLESGVIFVQRGSASVRQIAYNFQADKMLSTDLSLLAPHMLRDCDIIAWAYQRVPHSIVWMVRSDGTLVGLTFVAEQDVIGWHRHNLNGTVEDVTVIPGVPDDQLWLLVRRSGKLYIERMTPFFSGERESAIFLDSSLTHVGEAEREFTGLSHLEGENILGFADGQVVPVSTVEDGGAALQGSPACYVTIGIPYTSTLIPVSPETQLQGGHTLFVQRRFIALNIHIHESMGFSCSLDEGASFDVGTRYIQGNVIPYESPFFSEVVRVPIAGGYNHKNICISSRECAPLTILAIGTLVDVSPEKGSFYYGS